MEKHYFLSIFFFINLQVAFSQIVVSSKYRHFDSPSVYKIVEIIDARQEKDNVGLIIDEDNKKIDTVRLETKLEKHLKDWLQFNTVESESHFKYSLALKVNYLEFNKRKVNEDARYWLFYDIELYVINADSTYSKIYDGIQVLEGRADYGHKKDSDAQQFGLLHWQLWNDFQNEVNFIKYKNILKAATHRSLSEISENFALAPVFDTDSLKSGCYENLTEILNNDPKVKLYNLKKPTFINSDSTDKKNQYVVYPNEWYIGYCDGKQIYGNYNMSSKFIPLERLGTVFEASGYAKKMYNNDELRKNRVTNLGLSTMNAVTFPSNLNTGLVAVSAVGILVNLLKDSSSTRVFLDTRHDGKYKKIPLTILK